MIMEKEKNFSILEKNDLQKYQKNPFNQFN